MSKLFSLKIRVKIWTLGTARLGGGGERGGWGEGDLLFLFKNHRQVPICNTQLTSIKPAATNTPKVGSGST